MNVDLQTLSAKITQETSLDVVILKDLYVVVRTSMDIMHPWVSEKNLDDNKNHVELYSENDLRGKCFINVFNNKITAIIMRHCGLSDVPESIKSYNDLFLLDLSNNNISSLPGWLVNYSDTRFILLDNNNITTVKEDIGSTLNLFIVDRARDVDIRGNLYLHNNPLASPPPEIINDGKNSIISYYRSIKMSKKPLKEVKLILIGRGGAGKTSIVNRLLYDKYNDKELETKGINISNYNLKVKKSFVKLRIWDFGGQEIMHTTHKFFLSERSIYLVVLDRRQEDDPEYWLNHIRTFGKNSPVIVVLNKYDENPGYDVNSSYLKFKYPNIIGFYDVSCKNNKGIEDIKRALRQSVGHVEIVNTEYPTSWFDIKEHLENSDKDFISEDEYYDLCAEYDIIIDGDRDVLAKLLDNLGVIVHYPEFRLCDTHVINPRWLTKGVYKIINSDILAKNKGVLKHKEVSSILVSNGERKVFPTNKHSYIIDVMLKFELCYSLNDDAILIPDLLPVKQPDIKIDLDKSYKFTIHYDFVPPPLLPRLMVRLSPFLIEREGQWRTGFIIYEEISNCTAVIRLDKRDRRISIFLEGDDIRNLLEFIRVNLSNLHKEYDAINSKEQLPLPDKPNEYVSYSHLLKLEKSGRTAYWPDGADREYELKDLLGVLHIDPSKREEEIYTMLQYIFEKSEDLSDFVSNSENIFQLNPNFYGMGMSLPNLYKKWSGNKGGDIPSNPNPTRI